MSRIQPKWFSEAVFSLVPNAKLVIRGQSYEGLEWFDDRPKPTEAEISAEVARLQAEYDAQAYARSRASEYPPIGDQLDALWKGGDEAAAMLAKVQAVKAKYPKEQA
jgi:hypothetical protein